MSHLRSLTAASLLLLAASTFHPVAHAGQPLSLSVPSPTRGTVAVKAQSSGGGNFGRLEIYIDTVRGVSCDTNPCLYNWDTTRTTDGGHSVEAKLYDNRGRLKGTASVSAVVQNQADVTPPSVTLTAPSTATGLVTLRASATDTSGIVAIKLYVDQSQLSSSSSGSVTTSWDSTTVPDGNHVLRATAVDPSGNVGASNPVSVYVYNNGTPPSGSSGVTTQVPTGSDPLVNGDNLQLALNQAVCGDTIVLRAGATYATRNTFSLRNPGASCNSFITIQSSALAQLPEDVRVSPAQASLMPKVVTTTANPAFLALDDAHHWRLVGLEISNTVDVARLGTHTPTLVAGGDYAPIGHAPHHITVDRAYIHPVEETTNPSSNYRSASRGVKIEGAEITVSNSHIAGFCCWFTGTTAIIDSEAVLMVGGPGPLRVLNNFLEAWFNNIFTGGGDPPTANRATLSSATATQAVFSQVANLAVGDLVAFQMPNGVTYQTGRVTAISGTTVSYVPQGPSGLTAAPAVPGAALWKGQLVNNVEIRGNTLHKRPAWQTLYGPNGQVCKSFFEVKIAAGLVIDGNHFTGPVPMCNSIGLTVRNQDGKAPWSVVRDVQITNNLFDRTGSLVLQLQDNDKTATEGGNVLVANNLWTGFAGPWIQTGAGSGITIAHNTVRNMPGPSASILSCGMANAKNVVVRDNIVNYNLYGFNGDWAACWPGLVTTHNVLIDNQSVGGLASHFPNDHVAAIVAAVGFTSITAAGPDYSGFALAAGSPYRDAATDGTDIGFVMGAYRFSGSYGTVDVAVYRTSTGGWLIRRPADGGLDYVAWGAPPLGDRPIPADYDGDGTTDIAVYRASTGGWFIQRSTDLGLSYLPWGAPALADEPVPADYDGDGTADIAIYRTSTAEWFILRSTDLGLGYLRWGAPADVPVPADYDGDGKADIAVYRRATGQWFILRSTDGGLTLVAWGSPSLDDVPVPRDYDGDGRADIAVYRRSRGEWYIRRSSDLGLTFVAWGSPSLDDMPVPRDYDGDGTADIAVYRRSRGEWYIRRSSDLGLQLVEWGAPSLGDVPVHP